MSGLLEKLEAENKRLCKIVYPYYGICKDGILNQIILFTAPRTGININGNGWPVGHMSEGWGEDQFVPYYGRISIKNGRILDFTDKENSAHQWEKQS